jgi:hypothetical protein
MYKIDDPVRSLGLINLHRAAGWIWKVRETLRKQNRESRKNVARRPRSREVTGDQESAACREI